MPSYTTLTDDAPPREEPCAWLVVPMGEGSVSLCTSPRFGEPTMACTFTRSTLPQLRQIVALLEKP